MPLLKRVSPAFAPRVFAFLRLVIETLSTLIPTDCVESWKTICLLLDGNAQGGGELEATFYTEHGKGSDESSDDTEHRQVEVYESKTKRWNRGRVVGYSAANHLHQIQYEDGTILEQDLRKW